MALVYKILFTNYINVFIVLYRYGPLDLTIELNVFISFTLFFFSAETRFLLCYLL